MIPREARYPSPRSPPEETRRSLTRSPVVRSGGSWLRQDTGGETRPSAGLLATVLRRGSLFFFSVVDSNILFHLFSLFCSSFCLLLLLASLSSLLSMFLSLFFSLRERELRTRKTTSPSVPPFFDQPPKNDVSNEDTERSFCSRHVASIRSSCKVSLGSRGALFAAAAATNKGSRSFLSSRC